MSSTEKMNIIQQFKKNLIVSCQALDDEPLCVPGFMARMALAAQWGGAAGIRANTPEDIYSIKQIVNLPVIGIWKIVVPNSEVYITPNFEAAQAIYQAGADIIALDCTFRKNAQGRWAWELIQELKSKLDVLVMADISILEEGINAQEQGADLVSTTLAGYTSYSRNLTGPDFILIEQLAQRLKIPVMAEGRIWTAAEASQALFHGAYGVIIGSAITRPQEITRRFVTAIRNEPDTAIDNK